MNGSEPAGASPLVASNGWPVVRAPLAGESQGYVPEGGRVLIVDTAIPEHAVADVVAQLVASLEGRWEDAPYARRCGAPPVRLVHSATRVERRSRRKRPALLVVPTSGTEPRRTSAAPLDLD